MPNMQIHIQGLKEFEGDIKYAATNFKSQIHTAMRESVIDIQKTARQYAPIRSGTLRRSIQFNITDNPVMGVVYQDSLMAKYGRFIEFGTGLFVGHGRWKGNIPGTGWRWINGMRAQPFMGPAFKDNIEGVKRHFDEAIARIVRQMAGK